MVVLAESTLNSKLIAIAHLDTAVCIVELMIHAIVIHVETVGHVLLQ